MLEKTKGIILNRIKYSDSGIIAHIYTRKFGRQSFMIKGMRNRKTGKHSTLLQPMSIIDMEIYYKATREMHSIKEFSASFIPYDIHSNIKKSCVAIFLGEVLTSVLKEESPHKEMFDFIEESILYFNGSREGFANFHIAFLSGLSTFLGFEPATRTDVNNSFFDMTNGIFVTMPPLHGHYANAEISSLLSDFFIASYDSIDNITLTGAIRNEVLETLLRYYSLHLPDLKKIKSLDVLKEVFR